MIVQNKIFKVKVAEWWSEVKDIVKVQPLILCGSIHFEKEFSEYWSKMSLHWCFANYGQLHLIQFLVKYGFTPPSLKIIHTLPLIILEWSLSLPNTHSLVSEICIFGLFS